MTKFPQAANAKAEQLTTNNLKVFFKRFSVHVLQTGLSGQIKVTTPSQASKGAKAKVNHNCPLVN